MSRTELFAPGGPPLCRAFARCTRRFNSSLVFRWTALRLDGVSYRRYMPPLLARVFGVGGCGGKREDNPMTFREIKRWVMLSACELHVACVCVCVGVRVHEAQREREVSL